MQFIKKHFFLLCPLVCFAASILYCAVVFLLRVYFPIRRRDRETYEAIPLVRGVLIFVISLLPLLSSMIVFS